MRERDTKRLFLLVVSGGGQAVKVELCDITAGPVRPGRLPWGQA